MVGCPGKSNPYPHPPTYPVGTLTPLLDPERFSVPLTGENLSWSSTPTPLPDRRFWNLDGQSLPRRGRLIASSPSPATARCWIESKHRSPSPTPSLSEVKYRRRTLPRRRTQRSSPDPPLQGPGPRGQWPDSKGDVFRGEDPSLRRPQSAETRGP